MYNIHQWSTDTHSQEIWHGEETPSWTSPCQQYQKIYIMLLDEALCGFVGFMVTAQEGSVDVVDLEVIALLFKFPSYLAPSAARYPPGAPSSCDRVS